MNTRWNASAIAKLGLLTAVALVLGYVEHLLPITGIPGVKLGRRTRCCSTRCTCSIFPAKSC